jgi:hypothetical protein
MEFFVNAWQPQLDPALSGWRPFDGTLAALLRAGTVRLLDADALRAGALDHFATRQQLEARDREHGAAACILLPPDEAADALLAARRRVCFVSHAWRTVVHPDPDSATLDALIRFLRDPLGAHVVGVFVDFCCVPQQPRTGHDEKAAYKSALAVVASGFASPLGTVVARHVAIPPCPSDFAAGVAISGAAAVPRATVSEALAGRYAPPRRHPLRRNRCIVRRNVVTGTRGAR